MDGKELANKAKTKLQKILNNPPNLFFQKDVENRIEQTAVLINVLDVHYQMIDYAVKELYEVNYGSDAKADEYFDKYNDLIPRYNDLLQDFSDVNNRIDLEWDQDWYVEFQGI